MVSSDTSEKWLPDRERLADLYKKYAENFSLLLGRLENKLKACINVSSVPVYKARVKNFDSYYRKLLKNLPANIASVSDLPVITDIIGIRVICAFLQDITGVEKCLRDNFSIYEVERKGADRTFREFGYESTHILMLIPASLREDLELPEGLLFEVQVRTILQDAWAEVEHELVYKSEFSPFDLPLKRKLASINASLSLADIIFQEIRDYQNKLNRELEKRRGSFYLHADAESDLHISELNRPTDENPEPSLCVPEPPSSPYVQGTIDDMILDAIAAHNNGNLDRAIMIYTKIIESKPNDTVLSVIYKHRGMAFFAQSRYEEALENFRKSGETNPSNFRAFYYIGIVLSVTGREAEAVENFSTSLDISLYQPYVFFRRAQSYYHLGQYTEALRDLDKAVSLGFDREEEKRLRIRIAKKIDQA